MPTVTITHFNQWRDIARELITTNIHPDEVLWQDSRTLQNSLFVSADFKSRGIVPSAQLLVPPQFLLLAQRIAHHRHKDKWDKLYRLLWRLTHGEKKLLALASDELVHELALMDKAITRDAHKMKAFVRFCKYSPADNHQDREYFIAWYQPDHFIVPMVAPFFQQRFAVMNWSIITPDESVHWNGTELIYAAGKQLLDNPSDDLEQLWQTYYQAIFNPARINIKAMKKEMPVRFWPHLPETQTIPHLIQQTPRRVQTMLEHQEGLKQSAADFIPQQIQSLEQLHKLAKECRGCPLYEKATQTVAGIGAAHARLILVGEQPGDKEDLAGTPFVGPAGKVLRDVLKKLAIDSSDIYLTNAVKHFKFNLQGSFRKHASPSIKEINACKPWLSAEIELIKPQIILCLGLTAAKSLISPGFHMKQNRGLFNAQGSYSIGATYHPSAILRAPTPTLKQEMLSALEQDVAQAYRLCN